MANINEIDGYLDVQYPNGDVDRTYPVTKVENVKGLANWTEKEKAALGLLAANAYVIDDATGKTYKIGSENGKFYFVESDVSVKEIVDSIVIATNALLGETN